MCQLELISLPILPLLSSLKNEVQTHRMAQVILYFCFWLTQAELLDVSSMWSQSLLIHLF